MESHECKLFQAGELFDDQAECWFEITKEERSGIKEAIGEVESTKNLLNNFIARKNEYEMLLDDGRKGKIIITNMSNDPKRAVFKTSGHLK